MRIVLQPGGQLKSPTPRVLPCAAWSIRRCSCMLEPSGSEGDVDVGPSFSKTSQSFVATRHSKTLQTCEGFG